jgi:uncharacterized protein YjbI with pentapeptide repeats
MPDWANQLDHWQNMLVLMMNFILREGVPVRALEQVSFRRAESQMRNTEEGLLAALSTCSRLTGRLARLEWMDDHAAGSMVHRLRGERYVPMRSVALASLSFLDLAGQNFMDQDLFHADFSGSNLTHCNFFNADLRETNFTDARMGRADLESAWLHGANFSNTDLEHCKFDSARGDYNPFDITYDWDRIKFDNSILGNSSYLLAQFSKADFRGANLENADFRGAQLRGASLAGAALAGAKFGGSKLAGVDIDVKDFHRADVDEADFYDLGDK